MPLTALGGIISAERFAQTLRSSDLWPLADGRVKPFAGLTRRWRRSISRAKRFSVTANQRRTCGVDPGAVRVGLAIDDELGLLAHPRGTLDGRDPGALMVALRRFADVENVDRFVVGLPLDMSGAEGLAARRARELARRIAAATGRAVELWDERLSTVQARRALRAARVGRRKARERVDEVAACAILQSWIDARRRDP